jgi:hypothetical protein
MTCGLVISGGRIIRAEQWAATKGPELGLWTSPPCPPTKWGGEENCLAAGEGENCQIAGEWES